MRPATAASSGSAWAAPRARRWSRAAGAASCCSRRAVRGCCSMPSRSRGNSVRCCRPHLPGLTWPSGATTMPDAVDLIRAKRDGRELSAAEISWLIGSYTAGAVPDEQMSALLMAIYFRGLGAAELRSWTAAMISSGDRLDLSAVQAPTVYNYATRHRRSGGQGVADPRAAGGQLRRGGPAAFRPRSRAYRRHPGQAGVDPRLARPADGGGDDRGARGDGLCHLRRGPWPRPG